MIAFAARRDDGCGFKSVKISSSNGKFTITTEFRNLPADPLEYTLTLFSCNRDGEELTRKDFSFIPSEKAFQYFAGSAKENAFSDQKGFFVHSVGKSVLLCAAREILERPAADWPDSARSFRMCHRLRSGKFPVPASGAFP